MVTAGVYLIARSNAIFDLATWAATAVVVIGTITIFMGATIGSAKDDIKKSLAGSTMSQIGYMVLAAGLGPIGYVFAIFHLLTHAIIIALETSPAGSAGGLSHGLLHGALDGVMLALVLGFVAMFLLERFFHFHQHETPEQAGHHDCCDDGCDGHGHNHGKAGHAHAPRGKGQKSQLGWVGAAIGLTMHSILEGVALGAAVLAATAHDHGGMVAGLSTFLVILLHKPFDGLTVATLVRAAGKPARFAHIVNLLFSLVVPIGAAVVWFGVAEGGAEILPFALAFSAGTFICIASSDLLPELQFHRHDRVGLSAARLVGLALAGTIARLESSVAQAHDHSHGAHDHSHGAHDHSHDHDHSDPNHKH
jgi:zinc and cadmium transporter